MSIIFEVSSTIQGVLKWHNKDCVVCQICNYRVQNIDNVEHSVFQHVISQTHQDKVHQFWKISSQEQIIKDPQQDICTKDKYKTSDHIQNMNQREQNCDQKIARKKISFQPDLRFLDRYEEKVKVKYTYHIQKFIQHLNMQSKSFFEFQDVIDYLQQTDKINHLRGIKAFMNSQGIRLFKQGLQLNLEQRQKLVETIKMKKQCKHMMNQNKKKQWIKLLLEQLLSQEERELFCLIQLLINTLLSIRIVQALRCKDLELVGNSCKLKFERQHQQRSIIIIFEPQTIENFRQQIISQSTENSYLFPKFSQPRQAHRKFTRIIRGLMKKNSNEEYCAYLENISFKELKQNIKQGSKDLLFSNKDSDQISNIDNDSKDQSFDDVLDMLMKPTSKTNIPKQLADQSIIFNRKKNSQNQKEPLKNEKSIWISSDDEKIEGNSKKNSMGVELYEDYRNKLRQILPKNIKRLIIEK